MTVIIHFVEMDPDQALQYIHEIRCLRRRAAKMLSLQAKSTPAIGCRVRGDIRLELLMLGAFYANGKSFVFFHRSLTPYELAFAL